MALLTVLFYVLVPVHCVLEHLTNRHLCRPRVLSCVVLITLWYLPYKSAKTCLKCFLERGCRIWFIFKTINFYFFILLFDKTVFVERVWTT